MENIQYVESDSDEDDYDSVDEDFDDSDSEFLNNSLTKAKELVRLSGLESPEVQYQLIVSGVRRSIQFAARYGHCQVTLDDNNYACRQTYKTLTAPNLHYVCKLVHQCTEIVILGYQDKSLFTLYSAKDEDMNRQTEIKTHLSTTHSILQSFMDSGLQVKMSFGKTLFRTETFRYFIDNQRKQIEVKVYDTWEYDMNFERDRKLLLIHMLNDTANGLAQ